MERTQVDIGRLQAQLAQWGRKLDELVASAADLGEEARLESLALVHALEAKFSRARAKLDDLEAAGSEKWSTFEDGVENAWGELELAFGKLQHSRERGEPPAAD